MIYKYEENPQLKAKLKKHNAKTSEIYRRQKKWHPLWWGLSVGAGIVGIGVGFLDTIGDVFWVDMLIAFFMFAAIPAATTIAVIGKQRGRAQGQGLVWEMDRTIVLESSGFRTYAREVRLQNCGYGDGIMMYFAPYEKIKQITYNEYYDYIRIEVEADATIFSDFKKQKVFAEKKEYDIGPHFFYMIYDKKEELLEKLEEMSQVPIIRSRDQKEHEHIIRADWDKEYERKKREDKDGKRK